MSQATDRPGSDELTAGTPTYGASGHYDARYFAWQNSNIDIKNRIKISRFVPHVRPSDVVLDFGCAGGGVLAGLDCARRIGVELNDVARASAVGQYGIEAYKSLGEVPDRVADVAISNHVLEHIAAPYDALAQLRSKIKPDGKLVLVLPIDDFRAQRRWDPADINRHLYTWSPMNLGNLLDEAGYQPVEMKVLRHTLMRGLGTFAKLPAPLFDTACRFYSYARHRQELIAVARPRSSPVPGPRS